MSRGQERQFWTEFLGIYKDLPVLWHVKSPDYCNRACKAEAYEKLVVKLREIDPNADRDSVVRKINNFRSSFRRDVNKQRKSEGSDSEGKEVFVSSLWYFDLLSFLHDQRESNEEVSTSTMAICENEASNSVGRKPGPLRRKRNWKRQYKTSKDITNDNSDSAIMAKGWATQYSELKAEQKVFVRKLVSDVLFTGCLGKLDESIVLGVHKLLEFHASPSSP